MTDCTFCGRPAVRYRTLCRGHEKQREQGKELTPIKTPQPRIRACVDCGTVGRIKARDMCEKCYARANRKTCTVDGCTHKAWWAGLCRTHHDPVDRRAEIERRKTRGCDVDGCDAPHRSKGLCHRHYLQLLAATKAGREFVPDAHLLRAKKPKPKPAKKSTEAKATKAATKASKLPAGWDDVRTEKQKRHAPVGAKVHDIPLVPPTPPDMLAAAARLLNRHNADDLAWMLGLEELEEAS